jgi:hypothetical protein
MGPKKLTCNNFNSITQGYFCILGLLQVMIIKFNILKRYIVEEKIQIPNFEMKIFAFRGKKKKHKYMTSLVQDAMVTLNMLQAI